MGQAMPVTHDRRLRDLNYLWPSTCDPPPSRIDWIVPIFCIFTEETSVTEMVELGIAIGIGHFLV